MGRRPRVDSSSGTVGPRTSLFLAPLLYPPRVSALLWRTVLPRRISSVGARRTTTLERPEGLSLARAECLWLRRQCLRGGAAVECGSAANPVVSVAAEATCGERQRFRCG